MNGLCLCLIHGSGYQRKPSGHLKESNPDPHSCEQMHGRMARLDSILLYQVACYDISCLFSAHGFDLLLLKHLPLAL